MSAPTPPSSTLPGVDRADAAVVYRKLIGALLIWSIVPLPFLYLVLPPFWIVAAGAGLLSWARPNHTLRLGAGRLNLLAVLIVLIVVAVGGFDVGPLRPLGHMLLLVTAVRVISVEDRRSFLRAMSPVFLIWIVAVVSSTHIATAPYLAGSTLVWWWAGMRIHLLGLVGPGIDPPHLRQTAGAVIATIIIAVPLFIAVPRLGQSWVVAPGLLRTSGFSPEIDLSRGGAIDSSGRVELLLHLPQGRSCEPEWARLRGTAMDLVHSATWAAPDEELEAPEYRNRLVWLDPSRSDLEDAVPIEVELWRPHRYLFVPAQAVAVESPVQVMIDPAGGLVTLNRDNPELSYTVWVTRAQVRRLAQPRPQDLFLPERSPRIASLARQTTAGISSVADQAAAVERFLSAGFAYSLDASPPEGVDPVSWFLFEGREGHCELFAGAMVVMLRHLGIPARFVGGFNGGDHFENSGEVVVRSDNAHAWVEAWMGPRQGWQVFDPTPAVGVPGFGPIGFWRRLLWSWERVEIAWDRSILTFGQEEQMTVLSALGELATRARAALTGRLSWAVIGAALAAALGYAARRVLRGSRGARHRRLSAAWTIDQVAEHLHHAGVAVPVSATVRWIGHRAGQRWPQAASTVGTLVDLAEHELYGPRNARGQPLGSARQLWSSLRREINRG